MSWRFKTEAEFLLDDFTKQGDGSFYYPDGAEYQVDVSPQHIKQAPSLTQKQIEDIIAAGILKVGSYQWSASMFIDTTLSGLNYKCSCRWARHPLYCKCP